MHKFLYIIILVMIPLQASFAQGPPIYTDTPIFLGLEGRGFRTFGKYISKENATVYAQPFVIPYNITTKIFIGVIAPFLRIAPENINSQSGLGDVSLFAKILLYQKDGLGKTFRIAIKLQETFPTGDTDNMPSIGLGAYQTKVGLIGAYITTKYGLYGEFGYNAVGEHLDDNLVYNLAIGYPILPVVYPPKQLNAYLELNGNTILEGSRTTLFNSPGIQVIPKGSRTTLFISPGIQVIPSRRFLLEAGVQIPIKEDVPSGQKTNFIFTLGTRILIF
ncbi:MAG: transporter [Candidatus Anammoxibacter sp.]